MTPHLLNTLIMHYVYVLKSLKDEFTYIGYTADLNKRLHSHNSGLVVSTRLHKPYRLIYIEGYVDKNDAKEREERLKYFAHAYSQLKMRIRRGLSIK